MGKRNEFNNVVSFPAIFSSSIFLMPYYRVRELIVPDRQVRKLTKQKNKESRK